MMTTWEVKQSMVCGKLRWWCQGQSYMFFTSTKKSYWSKVQGQTGIILLYCQ